MIFPFVLYIYRNEIAGIKKKNEWVMDGEEMVKDECWLDNTLDPGINRPPVAVVLYAIYQIKEFQTVRRVLRQPALSPTQE